MPVPSTRKDYPAGQLIQGTVYRVLRHIATGGMGTVYEVEDTTIGKRYVLKTLHPELGDRQDLARRMIKEARTLALLQHPNIVEVFTAGMTSDALRLPFYVMERLDGQSVREVLETREWLELPHAISIAVDLLGALDCAHDKQVIHRDVKPDNIFLHRSPNGQTVTKLLDFGIMRVLDGAKGETQGRFLGTLRYAAPEQLRGDEMGPHTDIYAAALVLYEMVCGQGPFDDESEGHLIGKAHLSRPAPRLGSIAKQPVPEELDRLMASALAKNWRERPKDAFTFARDLRAILQKRRPSLAPEIADAPTVETVLPLGAEGLGGMTGDDLGGAASQTLPSPGQSEKPPPGETPETVRLGPPRRDEPQATLRMSPAAGAPPPARALPAEPPAPPDTAPLVVPAAARRSAPTDPPGVLVPDVPRRDSREPIARLPATTMPARASNRFALGAFGVAAVSAAIVGTIVFVASGHRRATERAAPPASPPVAVEAPTVTLPPVPKETAAPPVASAPPSASSAPAAPSPKSSPTSPKPRPTPRAQPADAPGLPKNLPGSGL